jgi:hypothetical protein
LGTFGISNKRVLSLSLISESFSESTLLCGFKELAFSFNCDAFLA